MTTAVDVQELTTHYAGTTVVRDVSLTARHGEIFGILFFPMMFFPGLWLPIAAASLFRWE